jgi:hypothetical protein
MKPAAFTAVNGKWPPLGGHGARGEHQDVPVWDLSAAKCSPAATLNLNLF